MLGTAVAFVEAGTLPQHHPFAGSEIAKSRDLLQQQLSQMRRRQQQQQQPSPAAASFEKIGLLADCPRFLVPTQNQRALASEGVVLYTRTSTIEHRLKSLQEEVCGFSVFSGHSIRHGAIRSAINRGWGTLLGMQGQAPEWRAGRGKQQVRTREKGRYLY